MAEELKAEDLRIDTSHAGEHSGFLHTNQTAVRITHLPTGVFVESKDERSVHANKQRCLDLLPEAIASMNTRAQLPSQGGNAVAWLNVATGCVTTLPVVVMDWDDEGEEVQSLYTHPADQVADDLTMVKASRELLEQIAVELEHDNDRYFLGRELRALLNGGRS